MTCCPPERVNQCSFLFAVYESAHLSGGGFEKTSALLILNKRFPHSRLNPGGAVRLQVYL